MTKMQEKTIMMLFLFANLLHWICTYPIDIPARFQTFAHGKVKLDESFANSKTHFFINPYLRELLLVPSIGSEVHIFDAKYIKRRGIIDLTTHSVNQYAEEAKISYVSGYVDYNNVLESSFFSMSRKKSKAVVYVGQDPTSTRMSTYRDEFANYNFLLNEELSTELLKEYGSLRYKVGKVFYESYDIRILACHILSEQLILIVTNKKIYWCELDLSDGQTVLLPLNPNCIVIYETSTENIIDFNTDQQYFVILTDTSQIYLMDLFCRTNFTECLVGDANLALDNSSIFFNKVILNIESNTILVGYQDSHSYKVYKIPPGTLSSNSKAIVPNINLTFNESVESYILSSYPWYSFIVRENNNVYFKSSFGSITHKIYTTPAYNSIVSAYWERSGVLLITEKDSSQNIWLKIVRVCYKEDPSSISLAGFIFPMKDILHYSCLKSPVNVFLGCIQQNEKYLKDDYPFSNDLINDVILEFPEETIQNRAGNGVYVWENDSSFPEGECLDSLPSYNKTHMVPLSIAGVTRKYLQSGFTIITQLGEFCNRGYTKMPPTLLPSEFSSDHTQVLDNDLIIDVKELNNKQTFFFEKNCYKITRRGEFLIDPITTIPCYNNGCWKCGIPIDRNFYSWKAKNDSTGEYCAVCAPTMELFGKGISIDYVKSLRDQSEQQLWYFQAQNCNEKGELTEQAKLSLINAEYEDHLLSLEQAEAKCKASLDPKKVHYSNLNLKHGKCCDITNGMIVQSDEELGTVCVKCGEGKLKNDGTPCKVCNGKTESITEFCYDSSLETLQTQPIGCFNPESLSEQQIKLCKSRGVTNLQIVQLENTLSGIGILIKINFFDYAEPELLEKLLNLSNLTDIIEVKLIDPDTNENMIKTTEMELITIKNQEHLFQVKIIPKSSKASKLQIHPKNFNLFGGVMAYLGEKLSQKDFIGECDSSNCIEHCNSSESQEIPNSQRRVLSEFSGLNSFYVNELVNNFTPHEVDKMNKIRLFKTFPREFYIVPLFHIIDIPKISYKIMGLFLGYFLWFFMVGLTFFSVRLYKKKVNLMKQTIITFLYINSTLQLGSYVSSSLLLRDFYSSLLFGFYGHLGNSLTLIFSESSLILTIYQMDKLMFFQSRKNYAVSILKVNNNSISIISTSLIIVFLIYLIYKRVKFEREHHLSKLKPYYGMVLILAISVFLESISIILVLQSKLYVLNALGWLGIILVGAKCFISQTLLLQFIQDILKLRIIKITNLHLFSLKTDILLDEIEEGKERNNKKSVSSKGNKRKINPETFRQKPSKNSKLNISPLKKKKEVFEDIDMSNDIDSSFIDPHKECIENNSPTFYRAVFTKHIDGVFEKNNRSNRMGKKKTRISTKVRKINFSSHVSTFQESQSNEENNIKVKNKIQFNKIPDSKPQHSTEIIIEKKTPNSLKCLLFLVFERASVKKLYLYLKYGNKLLKKKVIPPQITIKKFAQKFLAWIFLLVIFPKLSVVALPPDLEPASYLKIGAIVNALFILICVAIQITMKIYPTNFLVKNNAASLISQLESITILVASVYILLLFGVVTFNTFQKIVKSNKFYKVFKRNIGSKSPSTPQRNEINRTRVRQMYQEGGSRENEMFENLNTEKSQDAFGSVVQMGMMSEKQDFFAMIENMVYEQ